MDVLSIQAAQKLPAAGSLFLMLLFTVVVTSRASFDRDFTPTQEIKRERECYRWWLTRIIRGTSFSFPSGWMSHGLP